MSKSVSFLRAAGWIGPEELQDTITIIVCGAVGSNTALLAAKMGFHNFNIWDADIVDWTVESLLSDLHYKKSNAIKGHNSPNKNINGIILERADSMQILLSGNLYESPCRFCQNLFKRIAGECPIIIKAKGWRYSDTVCSPRIILQNSMFKLPEEQTIKLDEINLPEPTECG